MPPSRYAIAAVVLAFIAAALFVRIAHAIIQRLLNALDIVSSENRAVVHARAKQLTRALTRFGIAEPQWDARVAAHWSVTHGINLIIIVLGAFIAIRAANLVIDHLQFKLARNKATTDLEWQRRATTLGRILTSLVTAVVGFMAILML